MLLSVYRFSFKFTFILFSLNFKSACCLSPLWESIKTTVYEGYVVGMESGHQMKAIRKIMKPQDTEIIIGKDIAEGNQLVLSCTAWYPTKWVYTGDGKPEYTTNTTVEYLGFHGQPLKRNETNGAKRYRASIFLGYKRRVSPLDSGRYNCMTTSPDVGNKYYKLSAFYYLFVPGEQLFTRTNGDTIYYDVEKSPARIPCSVTDPRVAVSLQKFENGVLKCIQKEDTFYHPVSGFYPQTDIRGTYVCTAAYNNTFQVLYFNLVPAEMENTEDELQVTMKIQANENKPLESSEETMCTESSCGIDAECFVNENNSMEAKGPVKVDKIECKCPTGYFGDPYKQCHRSQLDWFA